MLTIGGWWASCQLERNPAIPYVIAESDTILSGKLNLAKWCAYLHASGYTEGQTSLISRALIQFQIDAFDSILPDGCLWDAYACRIHGPESCRDVIIDIEDLMRKAVNEVMEHLNEIESVV